MKIKKLQRILKNMIDEYRKVNKMKGGDFTGRMDAVNYIMLGAKIRLSQTKFLTMLLRD